MNALVQQCRAQHASLVLVTHSVLATELADRVLHLSAEGLGLL
jgi:putative ABC transport system ATP-binding protein